MPSSAWPLPPRGLHAFPTRRSSDLGSARLRPREWLRDPRPADPSLEYARLGGAPTPGGGRSGAWGWAGDRPRAAPPTDSRTKGALTDRKSTRLNSSHLGISYAVFCLAPAPPGPTRFPYTTLFRSRKRAPTTARMAS